MHRTGFKVQCILKERVKTGLWFRPAIGNVSCVRWGAGWSATLGGACTCTRISLLYRCFEYNKFVLQPVVVWQQRVLGWINIDQMNVGYRTIICTGMTNFRFYFIVQLTVLRMRWIGLKYMAHHRTCFILCFYLTKILQRFVIIFLHLQLQDTSCRVNGRKQRHRKNSYYNRLDWSIASSKFSFLIFRRTILPRFSAQPTNQMHLAHENLPVTVSMLEHNSGEIWFYFFHTVPRSLCC